MTEADYVRHLRDDFERLSARVEQLASGRSDDRIRGAENLGDVKASIRTVETRLKALEDGMARLTTHSTWLLRLIAGALLAAALQFALNGGLAVGFE